MNQSHQGGIQPKYTPLGLGIQLEGKVDFFTNSVFIKKLIPMLSVVFILIVVWGVFTQGYGKYSDIKKIEQHRISLLVNIIANNLSAKQDIDVKNSILPVAPSILDLEASFPKHTNPNSQTIIVVDENGIISASTPETVGYIGRDFNQIVKGAKILSIGDDSVYLTAIQLNNAINVFAQQFEITEHKLTIVAFQKASYIEELWWFEIGTSLSLAILATFVLILMTVGFMLQMAHSNRAEEIIIATGDHLNRTLDRGRSGLWDWDIARGHIFWSSSMFEILGLKKYRHVLSFGEIKSILHDEDREIINELNRLIETGGKVFDREFRMLHANGNWVWLHIRGEIVAGEYEGTIRLVGVASDVTEHKAIEERSTLADTRLRQAIENISEGFVMWDNDRRMVMCNKKFQEFFKLSNEAIIKGTHQDKVFAAGQNIITKNTIHLDDYTDVDHSAFEYLLEDGRWLHVSERQTSNGLIVSVGTDISHIKRHETKLVESEKELIKTVQDLELTKDLLETQKQELINKQRQLEIFANKANSANRAKTDFLANMSHELRTPLNAIIGFSELIKSQTFGEINEQRYVEYAGDIHKSGAHLLLVINDILDMSKIESGNMQLELQKVELEEVTASCMRLISPRASEQKVELDLDIKDGLYINADKRALKRILLNLLSNAVKFTNEGGHITLSAECTENGIKIDITDNGIGMNAEALSNIGKPFAHAGSSLTKNYEGAGIGLFISKSLTEMHGGSLSVTSEEGVGTLVSLNLPEYKKIKAIG
ncbi:MAG: PAS domain-containing protein [Rhizobiales bacterium]|nr:PAS domain-containing protein [Hyphomicrobiales bacterium]